MRQRDKQAPQSAEETVRDIPRATRRHFSAEEKIRIVLEGLRGEDSIENVETSHLPVRRTLDKIGIPKTTGSIAMRPAASTHLRIIGMISSFSDAGYLIRRPPHPRSRFF